MKIYRWMKIQTHHHITQIKLDFDKKFRPIIKRFWRIDLLGTYVRIHITLLVTSALISRSRMCRVILVGKLFWPARNFQDVLLKRRNVPTCSRFELRNPLSLTHQSRKRRQPIQTSKRILMNISKQFPKNYLLQ